MSIEYKKIANTAFSQMARRYHIMIERTVNKGVGCNVTGCRHNYAGTNCTLTTIHVGNTCDCDAEKCTCCDSYESK
jgi:hypothetical protein